jgi:spermidine synthase
MVRILLYMIVFVSGAVLMGFEIVGSRILAPYFGNSIFVWGSLISVVLAALSLGYYWGGRMSAQHANFNQLLMLLLVPGFLIFCTPFVYPAVNDWVATRDFGQRLNPLLASFFYFLIPSVFLGTISPYAIRLSATALATVGNTAGTLYALSTCGSILGTLVTAFYLIPLLGVRGIVHALGLTLLLVCFLSWIATQGPRARRTAASVLAMVSTVLAPLGIGWTKTLLEKDTFYHRIRVEEDSDLRYLFFNRTLQSSMNRADPTNLELLYSRFASLGLVVTPNAKRVLVIGLGGGSIPKKYHKEFPTMEIDSVEIDPEVIEIAKKFFHFEEDENNRVHEQDGRLFLRHTEKEFDLIVLDAYYADAVPFHLVTREFFATVEKKLSEDGTLVINLIGAVRGSRSRLVRAVVKTLQGLFPQIYIFPTFGAQDDMLDATQNVIVLASKNPKRLGGKDFEQGAIGLGRDLFPTPIRKIRRSFYDRSLPVDDVPLLTDDYAPTDDLLNQ